MQPVPLLSLFKVKTKRVPLISLVLSIERGHSNELQKQRIERGKQYGWSKIGGKKKDKTPTQS